MLTPERALGISREVFLTVVDGIDEGHIAIGDEPNRGPESKLEEIRQWRRL